MYDVVAQLLEKLAYGQNVPAAALRSIDPRTDPKAAKEMRRQLLKSGVKMGSLPSVSTRAKHFARSFLSGLTGKSTKISSKPPPSPVVKSKTREIESLLGGSLSDIPKISSLRGGE